MTDFAGLHKAWLIHMLSTTLLGMYRSIALTINILTRLSRPGIRERFVFHEHKYCINDFWYLFVANLRIMWPYEFRDTYSRNTTTGQYKISPDFEERIGDINVWTMSTDFFNRWPELHCDIPAFNSIPGPIVSTPRSTTLAIKAPTKTSRETAEVQEEDVYQSATFLPDEFDLLTSTYVFP